MKRHLVTIAACAAAMALCLAVAEAGRLHAEEIDWKTGALGRLAPTIGTYRIDEVLADAAVEAALADLLPPDARAALRENLGVVGPIDFIDGHLVLSGNRPHHGHEDTAAVWIKIHDGAVRVILQRAGHFTLYAREAHFQFLPLRLRAALAMPPGAVPWRAPPDGVTWVR